MTTGPGAFRTTRWTIVLGAASGDTRGRAALEDLCRTYWYPLYALARRDSLDAATAEDSVQGFFADLLSRGDVARADPGRGRFRAFLVTAFRNFRANQRDRERAEKRGGGRTPAPLEDAEERYAAASGKTLDPEALFDRSWALATIEEALGRLRRSYEEQGKATLFEALRPTIVAADAEEPRSELAERLGLSPGALKVAIHRLRQRFREALLSAVGDTVAEGGDVQAELARLFEALGA